MIESNIRKVSALTDMANLYPKPDHHMDHKLNNVQII